MFTSGSLFARQKKRKLFSPWIQSRVTRLKDSVASAGDRKKTEFFFIVVLFPFSQTHGRRQTALFPMLSTSTCVICACLPSFYCFEGEFFWRGNQWTHTWYAVNVSPHLPCLEFIWGNENNDIDADRWIIVTARYLFYRLPEAIRKAVRQEEALLSGSKLICVEVKVDNLFHFWPTPHVDSTRRRSK